MTQHGTVLAVDSLHMMRRGAHMRIRPETGRDGMRTELLGYLFSQTARLISEHNAGGLLMCVGTPEESWSGDENGANTQERSVSRLLRDAGIVFFESCEDDVSAAICGIVRGIGGNVVIASGRASLVGLTALDGVTIPGLKDPTGGVPSRWAEFAALAGSDSAGICGISGIGKTRARRLLDHTDDLEGMLRSPASADEPPEAAVVRDRADSVMAGLRAARALTDGRVTAGRYDGMGRESFDIRRLDPVRAGRSLIRNGVRQTHAAAMSRAVSSASLSS